MKNITPKYDSISSEEEIIVEQTSDLGVNNIVTPQIVQQNFIKSANFLTGVSGWQINADGDVEFNEGVFRGDVSVGSLHIPDEDTTANSFHVETDGDTFWGCTQSDFTSDNDNATAYILKTGIAKFQDVEISGGSVDIDNKFSVSDTGHNIMKSYSLISQYTAGENLTIGRLGCLKHKLATWGDDSEADRETTALFTATGFVHVDSANPTTNYDEDVIAYSGTTGAGQKEIYGKLDLSSNPPGLPAWNEVESVYLRMYVVSANSQAVEPTLYRLTSAFTESTVTWNTKPTDDGIAWATAQTGTAILTETMASVADFNNTGYVEFDITDLYRLWSAGKLTNHGFLIKDPNPNTADGFAGIGSRTRTGGGDFNQAPYLVEIILNDNPGSGNSITANDGKVYQASNIDYNLVKNIIGVIGETVSAEASVDIYALADRSIIPTSVISTDIGSSYYLNGTTGQISKITNDIPQTDKWSIPIGIGVSGGLSVDFGKELKFIKSVTYPDTGILPPPNARVAIIKWTFTTNAIDTQSGITTLHKDRINNVIERVDVFAPGAEDRIIEFDWADGTSGLFTRTITLVDATISSEEIEIFWYR